MRGVYCDGSSIRVRDDLPEPVAGEDEVVLTVDLVGICKTDLEISKGYMGFQGVLGHEFVGRDAGGKRYTSEINFPCYKCRHCGLYSRNHCPHRKVLGILGKDGAMAEKVVVPVKQLHAVPDELTDEQAVMIEPLAAAFQVTRQVMITPKQDVAVLGDGKLGILCAWVTRLETEYVTLYGKHDDKMKLAGPTIDQRHIDYITPRDPGYDNVIEATGSNEGLELALKLVRPRGTLILKSTVAAPHTMSMAPIVIDEIIIVGSRCGPFDKAIAALKKGTVDVSPLYGKTYPLAEGEAAFQAAAASGARKIFLKP